NGELRDWQLSGVYFASPTDGWATGLEEVDGKLLPLLFHFDGERWELATTEHRGTTPWLLSMCFDAAGHAWAAGWNRQTATSDKRGRVVGRENSAWREVPIPQSGAEDDDEVLTQISCVPGGVVVAGRIARGSTKNDADGTAWRYDGTWQSLPFPDDV